VGVVVKIKVELNEFSEQVTQDIGKLLGNYLDGDAIVLTDIKSRMMDYVQDLAPSDFSLYFKLSSVNVTSDGMLDITFEPTDALIMKIIREYYENRA